MSGGMKVCNIGCLGLGTCAVFLVLFVGLQGIIEMGVKVKTMAK